MLRATLLACVIWLAAPLAAMNHGGRPEDLRAFAAAETPGGPGPGDLVPNFRLTDHRGATRELHYDPTVRAVVLVFTGMGSPRALQTSASLRALRARYAAKEVIIWQIDSSAGVTAAHVRDDAAFVSALNGFLRPGGQLLLQFRNSLFSMFTFNRLTKEFVLDELLVDVPQSIRDVVAEDLDQRLAVDKPPVRTRPTGDGYDEILSRFHNPFELAEVVRAQGYSDIRFHWYNYHPAYPMLAGSIDPTQYRQAQMDLEGDTSWRGMFLCSAGLIEATKDAGG